MTMQTDIAIVGAGIAGLVAANYAAKSGARVTLIEAQSVGGRARSRTVAEATLNQGPHALYADGVFREVLAELAVGWTGAQPDLSAAKAVWPEGVKKLPISVADILSASSLDVLDKIQLVKLMSGLASGKSALGEKSVADGLAPCRERVRLLMLALIRLATYGNAPERLCARAVAEQLRISFSGVYYVDAGWSSLVDGLMLAAVKSGVQLVDFSPVERLTRENDGWQIRAADRGDIEAKALVLAIPPKEASQLLPDSAELKRLSSQAIPFKMLGVDLTLSELPDPACTFALGIEKPFYYSLHSRTASLAPEGRHVVHLAKYLPIDGDVTPSDLAELEAWLDALQPGWRAAELGRQRLLSMPVVHDFPQVGRSRAPVELNGVGNAFLAGDWVGDEAMLSDAAAASGRRAGQMAARAVRQAFIA